MIDEQNRMRPHMRFFVNGEQVFDLTHPLSRDDTVRIVLALSGGQHHYFFYINRIAGKLAKPADWTYNKKVQVCTLQLCTVCALRFRGRLPLINAQRVRQPDLTRN